MAGHNNHRHQRKSNQNSEHHETRRDRNPEKHSDNDRHRRRDRSRSRHRDDEPRYKKFKNDSRSHRDRFCDRNQSKFNSNDLKNKRESSIEFGNSNDGNKEDKKPIDKEKPNFSLSGKLTEDTNTVNGVVVKYCEPQDARKPKKQWRLYPFKGEKALPTLYVHRQSGYLLGRDRKVADIPLDHPSCSKQHAALQFRLVSFVKESGGQGKRVRPYLMDLESANGTFINNVKLEPKRYYELLERDVLKFGFSSREYVLLHESSKDDSLDDDVAVPNET